MSAYLNEFWGYEGDGKRRFDFKGVRYAFIAISF